MMALFFSGGLEMDRQIEFALEESAVSIDFGAQGVLEACQEDAKLISSLRRSIREATAALVAGKECGWLGGLHKVVLSILPEDDGAPWAGLPPHWVLDEDEGGGSLYRSALDHSLVSRIKPTEDARTIAERAKASKAEFDKYKAAGFGVKKAPTPDEAAADAKASVSAAEQAKAFRKNAAERQKDAAADDAAAKTEAREKALVRAKEMAKSDAEKQERKSVAWSVRGGLAALLKELDLDAR